MPYMAFLSGASMIMPDRFLQGEPLVQIIETEGVTSGGAVPTVWNDVLRVLDERAAAGNPVDTSRVRRMVVGGSAAPPAMLRAYEEKHGIRVLHGYGMTETSPVVTVAVPPAEATGEDAWSYRESQGRFMPLVEARIMGPDGTVQPWDGESVGELELRGNWITGEYYDPDPDSDAATRFDDGWLRTGDVGHISPDGFLRLTDRAKDVIKSGGEWISSVDLENALMAHPAVREASVVGVPDERWGERPLATVVVAEGQQVTPQELREFLADKVAKWQLPERWAFIDEVPKTSVGKFDKKVLRRRYAAGELDVATLG
jgi:fatty-acyl-CoA synthase